MGRTILAVLVGVICAWVVIMLCEFAGASLYPPPPGLDLRDPEQLAAFVAAAPTAAMALVLAGWTLGAFVGGWIAAKLSRLHRRGAALAVGAVVLAGVIANAMMIPHPWWFAVLGVLLPLPAAWLAWRMQRHRVVL